MHPQKAPQRVHCSCLPINDFAVKAEMVAVETFINMGNILWIFYDCLLAIHLEEIWFRPRRSHKTGVASSDIAYTALCMQILHVNLSS